MLRPLLTLHTPGRPGAFLGWGGGGTRREQGDKLTGRRIRGSFFPHLQVSQPILLNVFFRCGFDARMATNIEGSRKFCFYLGLARTSAQPACFILRKQLYFSWGSVFCTEMLKCHLPEWFSPVGTGGTPPCHPHNLGASVAPHWPDKGATTWNPHSHPRWDPEPIGLPGKATQVPGCCCFGLSRIPPSESSWLEPGKNTTTFFLAFYRVLIQGSVFTFECSSQL